MRGAVARTVAREDQAAVAQVRRTHVVAVGRLARDLGDDGALALTETADFVELPVAVDVLVLLRRRADDHAEDGLAAVPGHGRVAHGDRVRALRAAVAVAGFLGQVAQAAVRIADVQVAAAAARGDVAAVVGEHRADGREVVGHRVLGDEQDGVGQLLGAGGAGRDQQGRGDKAGNVVQMHGNPPPRGDAQPCRWRLSLL